MKLFLSSAGFDNENLISPFLKLLNKRPQDTKALFIPTALNTEKSREYIPVFLQDLYKLGIRNENISSYNLDYEMTEEKLKSFDLIFICPGDPEYLLGRIIDSGFLQNILSALERNMPYIGLSAGSDIIAKNLPGSLGLVDFVIECHAEKGSPAGPLSADYKRVYLSDEQALIVDGDRIEVLE